jgi:hypothetical protein
MALQPNVVRNPSTSAPPFHPAQPQSRSTANTNTQMGSGPATPWENAHVGGAGGGGGGEGPACSQGSVSTAAHNEGNDDYETTPSKYLTKESRLSLLTDSDDELIIEQQSARKQKHARRGKASGSLGARLLGEDDSVRLHPSPRYSNAHLHANARARAHTHSRAHAHAH